MLIGTIVGLIGSVLPEAVKIFQKSQENKLALKQMELQIQHAETIAKLDLKIENIKADASETRSLLKHDSSGEQSKWIASLRGSVRPLITYFFFGIFAFVQVYGMLNLDTTEAIKYMWNVNTQELYSELSSASGSGIEASRSGALNNLSYDS